MNYQETLDYLYSCLPMFHRIGAAAYKADLSNTIALCRMLGNPEKELRCIHIAGTNGKGSVSHMIASVLQESGYKTGLYTSPHLIDFRERIKINGSMIPEEYVINFVERYKDEFNSIQPSFFEWTVALCFDYFREEKVDIAVIETGLGGRLDSTNVIMPELSVITNISYDHQALLGDTLEKIAKEKAGIIKEGIPVVIGESSDETDHVFRERSADLHAPLILADKETHATDLGLTEEGRIWKVDSPEASKEYLLQLKGLYQGKNIVTAYTAIAVLGKKLEIHENAIQEGFAKVIGNTGLLGRWQKVNESPKIICDTGHNEAGVKEIVRCIKEERFTDLHWVLGMVNDKDVEKVLSLLPKDARYYFTKASIPRALDETILKEKAEAAGLKGSVHANVINAVETAICNSSHDDLIIVGGSTFITADLLLHLSKGELNLGKQ